MVYTAEKNRGLTLRLHYMLIAAWVVGALKTASQGAAAFAEAGRAALPQYAFLLAAQLANLAYQAASMRTLRSVARQDQLRQEKTKAWLHVLLDVAVMACVVLSDPALPHAPLPLSAMVVTSFLAVLDMLRLDTLLRLHAIKWLCFAFLEADHLARAPGATRAGAARDALHALAFGSLLPLGLAAVSEAYQRENFLHDCQKPPEMLGALWQRVLAALRRVPGLGAAGAPATPAERPHLD